MTTIYCVLRFSYNKTVNRTVPPLASALTRRMQPPEEQHKPSGRRMSIFNETELTSEVNPFVNATWYFTRYEAAKSAILAGTIFPIRLLLMLLIYLTVTLWLSLCLLGTSFKLSASPCFSSFRRLLMRPAIWLFMRGGLFVVGFYYIRSKGKKMDAKHAPVVVCNHINGFEAMLMCYVYNCSPVAAIEQISPVFLRPLMIALQVVPVDRKSEASRAAVLNAIKDRAQAATYEAYVPLPQVLLFPEGTTHSGNAIINFKIGAFAPGLPVQPVAVKFPFRHFDPCWVFTGPGMLMVLFRMLTQVISFMEVEYLPPHVPSEAELADPKVFAHAVRVAMAKALEVPFTFHGVDDVLLQFRAIKEGQAPEAALVPGGVERVQQFFSITKAQIEAHFLSFVRMDKDKKGKISFEDFQSAFEACSGHTAFPAQKEQLTVLFSLLDANEDGKIEFGEFLVGLALSKQGRSQRREVLRLVFDAFDREGRGHISQEDCAVLLKRMAPDRADSPALVQLFSQDPNAPNSRAIDSSSNHTGISTSLLNPSSTKTVTFEEFEAFLQAHPDFFSLFQANFYSKLDDNRPKTKM